MITGINYFIFYIYSLPILLGSFFLCIFVKKELMINSVRNAVLSILNKNNYGYLSPSDFNLFAANSQMEIFEEYFSSYNKVINAENARSVATTSASRRGSAWLV